jgi:1-acyl-sn-glycerol-3-phosphate acyltransferase
MFWGAYVAVRLLYRYWFRVESSGHEHVPRTGRAILAANHSGLLPFDGAMITADLMERLDPPRSLRAIVDHFAFALPWVGLFMQRTGQVPGTTRNFSDLLQQDDVVLVFPEGTRGIVKPWRERYRLKKFNVGFVELAIEHEAPIVPVAVIGAEEQAPILFGSRTLGKKVGMPIFPVTPTFPLLGPLGLLPYPSKYYITYGEPLWLHKDYPRQAAQDPSIVQEIARRMHERVQRMVDIGLELRAGRKLPRGEGARA